MFVGDPNEGKLFVGAPSEGKLFAIAFVAVLRAAGAKFVTAESSESIDGSESIVGSEMFLVASATSAALFTNALPMFESKPLVPLGFGI